MTNFERLLQDARNLADKYELDFEDTSYGVLLSMKEIANTGFIKPGAIVEAHDIARRTSVGLNKSFDFIYFKASKVWRKNVGCLEC